MHTEVILVNNLFRCELYFFSSTWHDFNDATVASAAGVIVSLSWFLYFNHVLHFFDARACIVSNIVQGINGDNDIIEVRS